MSEYFDQFIGLSDTHDYHPATALSLAIACNLAYQPRETVLATARVWGFENAEYIEVSKGLDIDTQCYVMADQNNIVVAFRGCLEINDWLASFQASRSPGPITSETKAHAGFQDALFPAVIPLTKLIDEFNTNNQKIWLTGHSLGAAQCSLFAGMLIEHNYSVYGVYTFASPRPGDDAFSTALNQNIIGPHFRVVNPGDIVPHIPPEPFFSHSGVREILIESLTDDSVSSWFDQRVEALRIFIASTGESLDVVSSHRLTADHTSYIPRLLQQL